MMGCSGGKIGVGRLERRFLGWRRDVGFRGKGRRGEERRLRVERIRMMEYMVQEVMRRAKRRIEERVRVEG